MSDYLGTYTPNLNLSKDTEDDDYSVDRVNENTQKIDDWANDVMTIDKAINNLSATQPGFYLDARQGKAVGDRLNTAEVTITNHTQRLDDLEENISNNIVATPTINYGMNSKITLDKPTSITPKFTIQGKTIINPLGKDGNCEDTSKWAVNNVTLALDSTNKVFGNNGIKTTLSNTSGYISKTLSAVNIDITKYYLVTAYLKNGNATNISFFKDTTGGGTNVGSSLVTDTTKFTRIGIVLKPTDLIASNQLVIYVNGISGQYAYVDGIMINEITSTEYALGATALLDKYPYVDSYACLQNPYIEVKHDNLWRNGNTEESIAWYTANNTNSTLSIVNGKFQLVTNSSGGGSQLQKINVKANTDYYLSGNVSGSTTLGIFASDGTTSLKSGTGTFNTGNNTFVYGTITNASANQTGTADSIMLTEGTTAPTVYKPCRIERVVLETKLTSDDSITYDNGEVTGQIWWKHKTLFGKDYDWQFYGDFTGCKSIKLSGTQLSSSNVQTPSADVQKLIKYDGKIESYVSNMASPSSGDLFHMYNDTGDFYISASDTDTGWAESINPNADEAKAFMNGWVNIWNNGTRYTAWMSIIDKTLPSAMNQSTTTSSGTSTTSLPVADGTKFIAGNPVCVMHPSNYYQVANVASISGNTITLSSAVSFNSGAAVGSITDNGTTNTSLLNYCKNNVAPNYEGYQLHYKLQNPEPITDDNCHIHGDIPKLDTGDNYLYLDSGIVLGEVANPTLSAGNYMINCLDVPVSRMKNDNESILTIYKNLVYNNPTWIIDFIKPYGKQRAYTPTTNFDTSATYTVDYKILATQAPQIGSIGCGYTQDIVTAINKLSEEVNNKQAHDSILDNIVDLSLYENIIYGNSSRNALLPWCYVGTTLYTNILIPITCKKTKPVVTLSNVYLACTGTDVTNKFSLAGILTTNTSIMIQYGTTDSTVISNIKANGIYGNLNIVADCRGRV